MSESTTLALIDELRRGRYDEAVIFTSFHQSSLPMARLAGIGRAEPRVGAHLGIGVRGGTRGRWMVRRVTGGPDEIQLARAVTPPGGRWVAGEGTLADLAGVLAGASAAAVAKHRSGTRGRRGRHTCRLALRSGRTGRAVGAVGVRHVVLGDQQAPCADSRTRACSSDPPRRLADIRPRQVVEAVNLLAGRPRATGTSPSPWRALSCQPRPAR